MNKWVKWLVACIVGMLLQLFLLHLLDGLLVPAEDTQPWSARHGIPITPEDTTDLQDPEIVEAQKEPVAPVAAVPEAFCDIAMESVAVSAQNEQLVIVCQASNVGPSPTPGCVEPWYTEIILQRPRAVSFGLKQVSIAMLEQFESIPVGPYTQQIAIESGALNGPYQVFASADTELRLPDIDRTNQAALSEPFWVDGLAMPCLEMKIQLQPLQLYEGRELALRGRVQNIGEGWAKKGWQVQWFVSDDEKWSNDDFALTVPLESTNHVAPGVGLTLPVQTARIPEHLGEVMRQSWGVVPKGIYLIAVADVNQELQQQSYLPGQAAIYCPWLAQANPAEAQAADVQPIALHIGAEEVLVRNMSQDVYIHWQNFGSMSAEMQSMRIYHSTDDVLSADDIVAGESQSPALDGKKEVWQEASVVLASDVPYGPAYLIVEIGGRAYPFPIWVNPEKITLGAEDAPVRVTQAWLASEGIEALLARRSRVLQPAIAQEAQVVTDVMTQDNVAEAIVEAISEVLAEQVNEAEVAVDIDMSEPLEANQRSAAQSDAEALPATLVLDDPVVPGEVLVSQGVEVNTRTLRAAGVGSRYSGQPDHVSVQIVFGANGVPVSVELLGTTGFEDWDHLLRECLWGWRLSGASQARMSGDTFTLNLTVLMH